MAKKQKRTFLNEKQNKELIEKIVAGNYDSKELCKKYNISYATFCRRVKDIREGKINTDKENSTEVVIKEESKEYTTLDNTVAESKLIPYYRNRIVKVGLVKDRHPMPCNQFIFENIDPENMFDYNQLDSIISQFILDKIGIRTVNNINYADHDLCVYVTGLQCALASLIKMCSVYNVSLTLMHWNKDTDLYESQVIFKEKFESTKDYFSNITGNIYFTDDCTDIDSVKNSKYIFVLKEIRNKRNREKLDLISNNTFLYKDEDLAWKEYLKLCKNASVSNDEISIYLESGRLDINDNYTKIRVMSRTYNFEAQKNNQPVVRNNINTIHKILVPRKEDLFV